MKIVLGISADEELFVKEAPLDQRIDIEIHNYNVMGIEEDLRETDENGNEFWIEDELSIFRKSGEKKDEGAGSGQTDRPDTETSV